MTTDPEPNHDGLDLDAVRETFEASTDFTVGIEEEFAILDPAVLDLEHRFEEMQEACLRDPELTHAVKGELIDTEIEIRSGRGETFADAAERQRARRARLFAIADEMGLALAAMGTHPWANYLDQHIIQTEHYRRLEGDLRWVAQRNNTWSLHVHVGIQGPDRAVVVSDRMRELLPPLLALSANSPFLDHRDTGLHSVRTEIFTRTFPRCGVHEPFGDWATYADFVQLLEDTDSIVEATQLWWSVRPHHSFGTVEVRICDAQTRGDESLNLVALIAACVAQTASDLDAGVTPESGAGFCGRLGVAQREIEENLWRAIRFGMDGEMIDFREGGLVPTRAILEDLVEWTEPARQTLGLPVDLLERNGAQRAYAGFAEGAPIEEIYRRAVEETRKTYAPEGAVSGR
ncbi:MAG TPA: YbdK family carboxylate-amine ligase [Solirubrobacterales bacterium]|nr:YbdK family carboxylate-amine ligase [Solirubrobacterales bacterium]